MAWTSGEGSKVFRAFLGNLLTNATTPSQNLGNGGNTIKAALFNNTPTPTPDAASASSAYNTGTWLVANEVTDATNWVAGGRVIGTQAIDTATAATVMFDAADTAGGGTLTIANAYGTLVYNDTVTAPTADLGICFNYFGGANSVTSGTFTIVWHTNGIFRATIS